MDPPRYNLRKRKDTSPEAAAAPIPERRATAKARREAGAAKAETRPTVKTRRQNPLRTPKICYYEKCPGAKPHTAHPRRHFTFWQVVSFSKKNERRKDGKVWETFEKRLERIWEKFGKRTKECEKERKIDRIKKKSKKEKDIGCSTANTSPNGPQMILASLAHDVRLTVSAGTSQARSET